MVWFLQCLLWYFLSRCFLAHPSAIGFGRHAHTPAYHGLNGHVSVRWVQRSAHTWNCHWLISIVLEFPSLMSLLLDPNLYSISMRFLTQTHQSLTLSLTIDFICCQFSPQPMIYQSFSTFHAFSCRRFKFASKAGFLPGCDRMLVQNTCKLKLRCWQTSQCWNTRYKWFHIDEARQLRPRSKWWKTKYGK